MMDKATKEAALLVCAVEFPLDNLRDRVATVLRLRDREIARQNNLIASLYKQVEALKDVIKTLEGGDNGHG